MVAFVCLVTAIALALLIYFNPKTLLTLGTNHLRNSAGLELKETQLNGKVCTYLDNENIEKPVLLLIHGVTADKDIWAQMAALFSSDYHIIIPDLPAHGDSVKLSNEEYTSDMVIEFVHDLMVSLNITRYYLIGNSMGGGVAGLLAARYPNEVSALTLMNTAGIDSPQYTDIFQSILNGPEHNKMLPSDFESFKTMLFSVFFKPPFIPNFILKEMERQYKEKQADFEKFFVDALKNPGDAFVLEQELENLTMPVLILWGNKDMVMDISSVEVLSEGIPHAKVAVLSNCGHIPMFELPQETHATVEDFHQGLA